VTIITKKHAKNVRKSKSKDPHSLVRTAHMSACKTVPTAVHNSAQNNSDNLPLSSRPSEVWYLYEQHFYTPIATVILLNNQHGQRVKTSSDNEFQTAKHNTNMSVCWTSAETPLADDFSVALHVEPASHLLTAF